MLTVHGPESFTFSFLFFHCPISKHCNSPQVISLQQQTDSFSSTEVDHLKQSYLHSAQSRISQPTSSCNMALTVSSIEADFIKVKPVTGAG